MSEILILKYSATVFWMPSTLTWRLFRLRMSRSASFARSSESSRPVKRAKANTFFSAPSSSRTFERMCFYEEGYFLGNRHRLRFSLLQHGRDPHLELGRLDRHGQSPAEARDQPLLHAGDFLRVGIAGDDDLLVRLDQGIESVEELFLRTALVGKELDVVDQEQVERVVVALELVERLLLVSAYHVRNVLLGVDVADACLGTAVGDLVADRLDQMRLAEADAAVDEQRVVRDSRVLRDLDGRCPRQLVRFAGDEAVEREAAVQARALLHN